jgi:uncharacterized RDD family membrane protein YckC
MIPSLVLACLSASPLWASAGGRADPNEYAITGSGETLWILRQRGRQYDVLAKPLSKEWAWQGRGLAGKPLAAVATDTRLVTFFPERAVLIHAIKTPEPITAPAPADANWPRDAVPLALCDTKGIGGQSGSVVAVVRLASDVDKASDRAMAAADDLARTVNEDGELDKTVIDTMAKALVERASGERLALARMQETRLGVFLYTGSEWKLLTSLPYAGWQRDEKVFAASTDGKLYLWLASRTSSGERPALSDAGRPIQVTDLGAVDQPGVESSDDIEAVGQITPMDRPTLMSYDGKDWRVELGPEQIGRLSPVAMVALVDHVALLGRSTHEPRVPATATRPTTATAPAPTTTTASTTRPTTAPAGAQGLVLLSYDITGGAATRQTIEPAEGVDLSGADELLGAARLGRLIILAWRPGSADKPILLGKVGLDGRIAGVVPLTILQEPAPTGDATQVIEIMMLAVLVAMFIPLFILRPKGPQKPFGLPKLCVPGNLLKRLVAGAIDLLPFMLAATAVFGIEPQTMDDLWEMRQLKNPPVEYAWWLVSVLGGYVAYGVIMEYRFQATVGKLITRLRVVGNGGDAPDLRACFLRNIVKIVELTTFLMALLIVLPIVTPFNQRLGDMLARTTVVEKSSIDLARRDGTLDVPEQVRPHEDSKGDPEEDNRGESDAGDADGADGA